MCKKKMNYWNHIIRRKSKNPSLKYDNLVNIITCICEDRDFILPGQSKILHVDSLHKKKLSHNQHFSAECDFLRAKLPIDPYSNRPFWY
jgi:hypothetical protein